MKYPNMGLWEIGALGNESTFLLSHQYFFQFPFYSWCQRIKDSIPISLNYFLNTHLPITYFVVCKLRTTSLQRAILYNNYLGSLWEGVGCEFYPTPISLNYFEIWKFLILIFWFGFILDVFEFSFNLHNLFAFVKLCSFFTTTFIIPISSVKNAA